MKPNAIDYVFTKITKILDFKEKQVKANLCSKCEFHDSKKTDQGCEIAFMLYKICLVNNLVLSVLECPKFKLK